jgi:hypothetical protein
MGSSKPVIFISYSHKDRQWLDFVQGHLQVAVANDHFETWDDRRIAGGADWEKEIDAALGTCSAFILLVSRHSLVSRFILKREVQAALEAHWTRGVRIYPIVVQACDLKAVPRLTRMNLRPRDAKALGLFSTARREQVMAEIAAEIRGLVNDRPAAPGTRPPAVHDDAVAPAADGTSTGQTAKVRGDGNTVVQVSGSGNTLSINGRK